MSKTINIIQDTREQNGWDFVLAKDVKVNRKKLDFGDYTAEGIEDRLVIERKASTGELHTNLLKHKKRFFKEMELMKEVEKPYIVCEFPESYLYTFPENSTIPKREWKLIQPWHGRAMLKHLYEIQEMGIDIVYFDSPAQAENFALFMMRQLLKKR